jgi:hypothetical protein
LENNKKDGYHKISWPAQSGPPHSSPNQSIYTLSPNLCS